MKTTTNNIENTEPKSGFESISATFNYKGKETPCIIIEKNTRSNTTKIELVMFRELCKFWTPTKNLSF